MKSENSKPLNKEVFASALENMQSTWKTFALALGALQLLLIIDMCSGGAFLKDENPITIGDFEIAREALSATYGLVFTYFVTKALLESRVVKKLCADEPAGSISEVDTKAVLWPASPFSPSPALRRLFWAPLAWGFVLLAIFTVIHVFNIRSFSLLPELTKPPPIERTMKPPVKEPAVNSPPPKREMIAPAYIGIGIIDFGLLVFCLWRRRELVENYRIIRAKFTPWEDGPAAKGDQRAL